MFYRGGAGMDHEFYMNLAIQNAMAMKGQTDPNPLVGAVIVNDNRIVGVGAHLQAGESHAEIHALQMARDKAKGGAIYVTLEPCSHYGRTPPCAEAIIRAGIQRVVIATLDPNPLVSGNGVKILKEHEVEVIIGVCEEEAKKMNEVFNKYITKKQPFVTIKAAATLDGKIATDTFDSKWITSEEARCDVHQLRHENQAILVGINTVIQDNPSLTARIPNGRNPIRVIVDSALRIPLDAKVVTDYEAETWIFTTENHSFEKRRLLEESGIKVWVTSGQKEVDLQQLLQILGEHSVSSLFVEGGGTIQTSFFKQKLVDKFVLYIAPKLVGGENAPTFLKGVGIEKMSDAIEFSHLELRKVGKDYKFVGYPVF